MMQTILLITLCTLSTDSSSNLDETEPIPTEAHHETAGQELFGYPPLVRLISKKLDNKSFTKFISVNKKIQVESLTKDLSDRKELQMFQSIASGIKVIYPHGSDDLSESTIDYTDYSIFFGPKYIEGYRRGEGQMEPAHGALISLESFRRGIDPAFIVKFEVPQQWRHIKIMYSGSRPVQHVTIYLDHSKEEDSIERTESRNSYSAEFDTYYQAKGSNFEIEIPNTFDALVFKGQRFPCNVVSIGLDEENPKLQFKILQ